MIFIIALIILSSSCVNGKREQIDSSPSFSKIEIPLSWQSCKEKFDCVYNYDKCGNAYVFNIKYSKDFRIKADSSNLVCYDYNRKPLVNSLNCLERKCVVESYK